MQTQVTCPQCGTPFAADVHQIVDSQRTPQLKQALLNGQLNVASCPSCGFAAQMGTLLMFHDAEHEICMVHVPQQLNLNEMQREQMIGQLTQQVMNSIPQEQRKMYLFQPEIMLNYQTFLERVLETEGITKEMIARQREQSELLQKLAGADKDVANYLIKENMRLIDDQFMAMLQMFVDQASQLNDNQAMLKLTNLRAKLMTDTPAGRQLEKRQIMMHKLNQAAKKQGGLSPQLLFEQIVAHIDDDDAVDTLVSAGQQAVNYELFSLMTAEVEKRSEKGETAVAQKLGNLRDQLIAFQQKAQDESRAMIDDALQTLQAMVDAPDKMAALRQYANDIDDVFMYVLSAKMAEAEEKGDEEAFNQFADIQELIMGQVEQQLPPEIQLLNQLVRTDSPEAQAQILDQNQALLSEEMLGIMDRVIAQSEESGQGDLNGRLQAIKEMIAARLVA